MLSRFQYVKIWDPSPKMPYSIESVFLPGLGIYIILLLHAYNHKKTSIKQMSAQTKLFQALCLPISVSELLQKTTEQSVSYLVVDCRPRDQFDSGHLPGAVHLDPDTMLSGNSSFLFLYFFARAYCSVRVYSLREIFRSTSRCY